MQYLFHKTNSYKKQLLMAIHLDLPDFLVKIPDMANRRAGSCCAAARQGQPGAALVAAQAWTSKVKAASGWIIASGPGRLESAAASKDTRCNVVS
jgi:hypothetical protein